MSTTGFEPCLSVFGAALLPSKLSRHNLVRVVGNAPTTTAWKAVVYLLTPNPLGPAVRLQLTYHRLQGGRSNFQPHRQMSEQVTRIELVSPAWQASILPLNHTCSGTSGNRIRIFGLQDRRNPFIPWPHFVGSERLGLSPAGLRPGVLPLTLRTLWGD